MQWGYQKAAQAADEAHQEGPGCASGLSARGTCSHAVHMQGIKSTVEQLLEKITNFKKDQGEAGAALKDGEALVGDL